MHSSNCDEEIGKLKLKLNDKKAELAKINVQLVTLRNDRDQTINTYVQHMTKVSNLQRQALSELSDKLRSKHSDKYSDADRRFINMLPTVQGGQKLLRDIKDKWNLLYPVQEKASTVSGEVTKITHVLSELQRNKNASPAERLRQQVIEASNMIINNADEAKDFAMHVNMWAKSGADFSKVPEDLYVAVALVAPQIKEYKNKHQDEITDGGRKFGYVCARCMEEAANRDRAATRERNIASESYSYNYAGNNANVVEIYDSSGDVIAVNMEDLGIILTNGKIDRKKLYQLFDGKYKKETYEYLASKGDIQNTDCVDIVRHLEDRAIELPTSQAELDEEVNNLTSPDKAVLFASELGKSGVDHSVIQQSTEATLMDNVNRLNSIIPSAYYIGVAAGDDNMKKFKYIDGVWIQGLYSQSTQKILNKNILGYRNRTYSGSLGIDFILNDDIVCGISYSNINSKFHGTRNSINQLNELKVQTDLVSLYGKIDLNSNVNFSTTLSLFKSLIRHDYRKVLPNKKYRLAHSKFSNTGIGIESMLGYTHQLSHGFTMSSHVGMRFITRGSSMYTESGSGVYNLDVVSKSNSGITGVLSTKISKVLMMNNTNIVPSLMVAMYYKPSRNKIHVKEKYVWQNSEAFQQISLGNTQRYAYTVGSDVKILYNNCEIIVHYGCTLKKKFIGHQGALKLKISI